MSGFDSVASTHFQMEMAHQNKLEKQLSLLLPGKKKKK